MTEKCSRCGKRPRKINTNKLPLKKCEVCILQDQLKHSIAREQSIRDCWWKQEEEITEEVKQRVKNEKGDVDQCRLENRRLKAEVTKLTNNKDADKKWDFSISVEAYHGQCGEGYLQKMLDASKLCPHVFQIAYTRN